MDKRPYTPPTIVRVKLEHQQAVLAQCSTTATSLSTQAGLKCKLQSLGASVDCRKAAGNNTGRQQTATS